MVHKTLEWARRDIVGLVCAVVVLSLIVLPRNASALMAVMVALTVPVLVLLLRPIPTITPSRKARWAELAVLAPAVISVVAALFAESVPVGLWGIRGQHTGAWLWVALAAVFIAFVERAREGDLVRASRAIALTGALLGSTAFFTRHALVNRYAWLLSFGLTDSAPGLVENSISLAQILLVALGAAGMWGLSSRGRTERYAAAGAFIVAAGGLWVTETRAAYVAVVVALALLVVLRFIRLRLPAAGSWLIPATAVVLALALLAGTWVMGSLDPQTAGFAAWNDRLSARPAIWGAATELAVDDLVLGRGPDHFTAWTTWDSVPGRSMEQYSTDDPHSLLLYWLLAAGVPGLGLVLVALWALVASVTRALDKAKWRWAFFALATGMVAWLLLTLTAWTGPLAALFAAILAGSTLGAVEISDARSARETPLGDGDGRLQLPLLDRPYVAAVLALVLTSGILFTGIGTASAEMVWANTLRSRAEVQPERLVELAEQSQDPSYATDAARLYHARMLQTRDQATARVALDKVGPILERHATWSVAAGLAHITLTADSALLKAGATPDDLVGSVVAAKQAAPNSGIWDYVGAVQFTSLGRAEEARTYAANALDLALPSSVRDWCEGLVAQ